MVIGTGFEQSTEIHLSPASGVRFNDPDMRNELCTSFFFFGSTGGGGNGYYPPTKGHPQRLGRLVEFPGSRGSEYFPHEE